MCVQNPGAYERFMKARGICTLKHSQICSFRFMKHIYTHTFWEFFPTDNGRALQGGKGV